LNIDPELYPAAIEIRRVKSPEDGEGTPVAWIELLSRSNKPGGSDHTDYEEKRQDVIQTGQVLIEIDYLHQSSPVIDALPRYKPNRDGQVPEGASPYYVSVIDPKKADQPGKAVDIYQFGPEDPIPTINIPLPDRVIRFDLDSAYNTTVRDNYAGAGFHEQRSIDYQYLPSDIKTFSKADQDKIAARLSLIEQADREGYLHDPDRTQPLPLNSADIPNGMTYWIMDHTPSGGSLEAEAPDIDL